MSQIITKLFLVKDKTWISNIQDSSYIRKIFIFGSDNICIVISSSLGGGQSSGIELLLTNSFPCTTLYKTHINLSDFVGLLDVMPKTTVEKVSYYMQGSNFKFPTRVDVYQGQNNGLQLVQVTLKDEDLNQEIEWPEFFGQEVTEDKKYYDVFLAKSPYSKWK